MRIIDADALKEELISLSLFPIVIAGVNSIIDQMPTINPDSTHTIYFTPVSKWNPVGKELPKEGEAVLISFPIHGYSNLYIENAVYSEGKFLKFAASDLEEVSDVKAWMPLPEPYKENKDVES